MTTAADYIGRTVDMTAFQGATLNGDAQLAMALSLPGEGGRASTGVAKLGQRFMLSLLMEKGTVKHFVNRGSTFLTEIRSGYVRSSVDLFAAFTRALLDVGRELSGQETENDPPDERFGSAEILNVALSSGKAVVSVKITSRAAHANVILPITVSLR